MEVSTEMKKDEVFLNPYLYFNGNCAEAMKFYQSVLGGELKMQKYSETGMPTSDEVKDKIIHAFLKNDMLTFMASDGNKEYPVSVGNNIQMSISGENDEMLRKYFSALSNGGNVDMPLKKQFWGDTFGTLTDKFGVHWMINIGTIK
jgi:PhnB protein